MKRSLRTLGLPATAVLHHWGLEALGDYGLLWSQREAEGSGCQPSPSCSLSWGCSSPWCLLLFFRELQKQKTIKRRKRRVNSSMKMMACIIRHGASFPCQSLLCLSGCDDLTIMHKHLWMLRDQEVQPCISQVQSVSPREARRAAESPAKNSWRKPVQNECLDCILSWNVWLLGAELKVIQFQEQRDGFHT